MTTDGRPPRDPRAAALDRRRRRGAVTDPAVVLEAAAAYLASRPRSVAETRAHLATAGYPASPIETAIERLVELGILDDRAFALAWIGSRDRTRPRSSTILRRELAAKEIDPAIVEELLAVRDAEATRMSGPAARTTAPQRRAGDTNDAADVPAADADEAAARRLLERKRMTLDREADPARRRAKAWSLLARHGFGAELCARLLGEIEDGGSDPRADEPATEAGPEGLGDADARRHAASSRRAPQADEAGVARRASGPDRSGGSLKRTPLRPGGGLARRTPLVRGTGLSRRPPTR